MEATKNRTQICPERSLDGFQPALSVTKRYCDLEQLDEFETFYDRRLRRIRVVSTPWRDGDRVWFSIAPVSGWGVKNPIRVQFQASAQVKVFCERTIAQKRQYSKDKTEWLRAQILETLTEYLQSSRQLSDAIRHKTGETVPPHLMDEVLRQIPEEVMVRRYRGLVLYYRRLIEFTVGMPVVENPDRPSMRYGWVEKLVISRQHGTEFPVCRWLAGLQSFSGNDLLERVANSVMLARIEQAKAIFAGQPPAGFIELPYDLLRRFARCSKDRHALLQLAKLTGVVPNDQEDLKGMWQTRSQVKEYLNQFYPEILELPKK